MGLESETVIWIKVLMLYESPRDRDKLEKPSSCCSCSCIAVVSLHSHSGSWPTRGHRVLPELPLIGQVLAAKSAVGNASSVNLKEMETRADFARAFNRFLQVGQSGSLDGWSWAHKVLVELPVCSGFT